MKMHEFKVLVCGGRGTLHMVNAAKDAGVKVLEVSHITDLSLPTHTTPVP